MERKRNITDVKNEMDYGTYVTVSLVNYLQLNIFIYLNFNILLLFYKSVINYESEEPTSWKFWRKRRYVVGSLAFLGFFTSYILRVNLSVAIVAMTANNSIVHDNGSISYVSMILKIF